MDWTGANKATKVRAGTSENVHFVKQQFPCTQLCVVVWDPLRCGYGFSRLSTHECKSQDVHTLGTQLLSILDVSEKFNGSTRVIPVMHVTHRPKFVERRRRWYTYEFRMIFQLQFLPFEVWPERRRALTWFFHTLISDTRYRATWRSKISIRYSIQLQNDNWVFAVAVVRAILFLSVYDHSAHIECVVLHRMSNAPHPQP